MAGCGIDKHVDVWEWEGVFGTGLVKVRKVDAHFPLTIFLPDNDNVG